jgi:Xaa-Pro aminopeptidase
MKDKITARLTNFRSILHRENLDAWYISGTDPHMSEYLCGHWQTRLFATGFSGSYGEVVITKDSAGLWTDTRYFIQAEEQLAGTGIQMHKLRVPGAVPVPRWLKLNLPPGGRLGIDPWSTPLATFRAIREELDPLNIEVVALPGVTGELWTDRPPLPQKPVFELEPSVTGESRQSKLQRIAGAAEQQGATCTIITALDDLAWSFNLRGHDVDYNPVFMGYAIIGKNHRQLFMHKAALPEDIRYRLAGEGVVISDYGDFGPYLENMQGESIFIDPAGLNTAVWEAIRKNNRIVEGASIATQMKAIKNETELAGFREAMRKDGITMVNFLHWLSENVKSGQLTEYTIGRKLAWFRSQQPGFRGESFSPIVGYAGHGAVVHLSVDASNAGRVIPEGILLFDSGGQYTTGTTDITRTAAIGPVTANQKRDFTLVLKGMIKLSMAIFPAGTKGMHLDVLARQSLWENGLNYGHGTGHGVGHFLSVHEGPASIRQEVNANEIRPGMVFSNEPGLYRTGEYGIRTENMMVCVEKETTPFGQFLAFETLTLCPIDTTLVVKELLSASELEWLNNYHQKVREELLSLLPEELKDYLSRITAAIKKN